VAEVEAPQSYWTPATAWKPATTYEWDVVVGNDLGDSAPALWTFRTMDSPPAPPGSDLLLVSPLDRAESLEELVLAWQPSPDSMDEPAYYSVLLWEAGSDEHTVVAHVGSSTEYRPLDVELGGRYVWQVVAANDSGEAAGPVWEFAVGPEATPFQRGDVDGDGTRNISDPIRTLNWLFLGSSTLDCLSAADFDDSGSILITDAIAGLQFLFNGGLPPAPPAAACGEDPTPLDGLTCGASAACG
jgi:hypothetical protein